ncbi:MAG: alpha/beta fold hydrolase [Patescibacteria group bacterium]
MSNNLDLHWYYGDQADVAQLSSAPDRIVIYTHGYGVKWHSKRLFSDIAGHLAKQNIASALFNLSDYDDKGNATFLPLSDQQERLRSVLLRVKELYPIAEVTILGHSMGCGVIMTAYEMLDQMVDRYILLAPAVGAPGPRIYEGMSVREGAEVHEDGSVSFPRKDGTTSTFSHRYVQEFSADFDEAYNQHLPQVKDLHIILAEADQRSEQQMKTFMDNGAVILEGSDHNFENDGHRAVSRSILGVFQ